MPNKKCLLNLDEALAALYTICAYMVIFAPYQGDSPMYNSALAAFFKYFQYAVAALGMIQILRCRIIEIRALFPISACLLSVLVPYFHSYTAAELSGFLMILLIIVFMCSSSDCQLLTFVYFRKAWVWWSILGLFCYFSFLFSLPVPYRIINYYARAIEGVSQNYVTYGIIFLHKQGTMIRLCGMCNEPGWWGTVSALLLCSDELNLRKKENWIILAAGIASASLAFVVLIALYILMLVRKNAKAFIAVLSVLVCYLFILPNIDTGNDALNYLISRTAIIDGRLAGDNRSTEAIDYMLSQAMKNHPLIGYGAGYSSIIGNLSIKNQFIDFGIIGVILMYGSLLISALIYAKGYLNAYFLTTIFFVSAYQRPNIFMTTYIMVLFGGIEYIKRQERSTNTVTENNE